MNQLEAIGREIVARLRPINPEKVILFGSHAWGSPDSDSDVDVYVVTRDDFMPQNFAQKMEMKLAVARHLADLRKVFSIDLLVHTMPMHRKFVELNSSFSRQIMSQGVSLL
jgi:predicted nucleotidyltransferase